MISLHPIKAVLVRERPQIASRWLADHEFLPPALEILESPPSPVSMAMILVICGLATTGLAWSCLGHIELVTSASGKLQPVGRVKVVQPLENGRIRRIRAVNGDRVRKNDVLIELDASDAEAEASIASLVFDTKRAEVARRIGVDAALAANQIPTFQWSSDLPQSVREREEAVARAEGSQLAASLAVIEAQRLQKLAERDQIVETMRTQRDLIDTLKQRVDIRTGLMHASVTPKSSVIDATETLQYQVTQLAIQKGQLVSSERGLTILTAQAEKARQDFRSENADKLRLAQQEMASSEQELAKARAKLEHALLRAPESGLVQASVATNLGQVVTTSEEVMRIVPDAVSVEVEGYILNRDVGFVQVGQDAMIKVDAFPFTRYGVIQAHVMEIAKDALPQADVGRAEGRASASSQTAGYGGTPRIQDLVFPIRLKLDTDTMMIDGRRVPLTSGMAVTINLQTGRQRIIDYLLSPLREIKSEALHER